MKNYRNEPDGKVFKMLITGSDSGEVTGTDIYLDSSNISRAAVHAGVINIGVSGYVYIKILPIENSYTGITQNGIISQSHPPIDYETNEKSYSFVTMDTDITNSYIYYFDGHHSSYLKNNSDTLIQVSSGILNLIQLMIYFQTKIFNGLVMITTDQLSLGYYSEILTSDNTIS